MNVIFHGEPLQNEAVSIASDASIYGGNILEDVCPGGEKVPTVVDVLRERDV